jgi:hypothetical protein
MLNKIPKLAKIFAVVHLIFSSAFFISMAAYSSLKPNVEGAYPLLLLVMMMIVSFADYPFTWLVDNWSILKALPGYLQSMFIIVTGTILWFFIGFILSKVRAKALGSN